jgi:L-lactate dehydrogenase complex protein LldG
MSLAARENILNKIQQALKQQVPVPFPTTKPQNVFTLQNEDLEIEFAEKFTKLQGKFAFCSDMTDLVNQLQELTRINAWTKLVCNENEITEKLESHHFNSLNKEVSLANCEAAITSCEALIARTGSLLLSSATQSGRDYSVYAPIHICIAYSNQLVFDIGNGIDLMKKKYAGSRLPSSISLATGPSRTADIEKTLVVGVHGPKEVYCFLVDA